MLKLANPNQGIPGSYRWRDKELALIDPSIADVGPYHGDEECLNEVNKRRVANKLRPITMAEFQNDICATLPPGWCVDEANRVTTVPGNMAIGVKEAWQGTQVLAGWVVRGCQRVEPDEVRRRTYICNSCPMHVPIDGCKRCGGAKLRELINTVIGGKPLASDAILGACGVCKCSLVAKTRMRLEEIRPHMTEAQRKALWEKCWIREEAQA